MNKIKGNETTVEVIAMMSQGNPGAMRAMMELINTSHPNNRLGGLGMILLLDTFEIYGWRIYVLWNDVCDNDTQKMISLLLAVQFGKLEKSVLQKAANAEDRSGKKLIDVGRVHALMMMPPHIERC